MRVPDEFDGWVRETIRELNEDFSRIKEDHLKIFARLEEESLSRKDFAKALNNNSLFLKRYLEM